MRRLQKSTVSLSDSNNYDTLALTRQIRRWLVTIIYTQLHIDTELCWGKLISTWIFEKGGNRTNFPVKICKTARRKDRKNPWVDTSYYNELIYASLVANV